MVQSSGKRGDAPRTWFKIILMLGLALAGVAAMAAEPAPSETATTPTTCAETQMVFGGRIIENGEVTDTWTLVCWRRPVEPTTPSTAVQAAPAKPVAAVPVAAGQPVRQTGQVQGMERF